MALILFLFTGSLLITGNPAFAQCTISPDIEAGSPANLSNMGNSFTACQTGVISTIRVLSASSPSGRELSIYAGEGVGGSVLGSKTGISLTTASNYTTWSVIDMSTENISVTAGSKYTFYFTTDVEIYYVNSSNIVGGNMYQDQNQENIVSLGSNDLRFEIDIVGPSNAAPTATAPSAPSVTEDDTNVDLEDDIQVADTEADDQTLTFTITGGTLTTGTTGITFGGGGNGSASFTINGRLADINTALDLAIFTPTANLSGTNAATISFTTNDGTATSSAASVTFDITAVNDEPSLTATGTNPTFTEDGSAAVVFSSASASTIESGQTFSSFIMTLSNVNDGYNERLNLDGSAIVLTHGTSGTTAGNSFLIVFL